MQLGLGMMPPMMSMWTHQLQSQLQTQIETTIQRALAENFHIPQLTVFWSLLGLEGQITVLFRHTVISQEGKELILVRGPTLQILKVKKQVLTLRVRTAITALSEEELLILITVQENQNSLMTIELKLMLLLMRSFWKAVKMKKTSNVPSFNDFHKEVPRVKLSESTMEWWLRHRSKLIKKDKFEELVNQYAFDPSIDFWWNHQKHQRLW